MNTNIFQDFIRTKNYSSEIQNCINETVNNLLGKKTEVTNPGMLLGKIQSGKTNTFIGIIALAFDKGYDISVIFTKGTRALTEQTTKRLNREFKQFIDDDIVKEYDIMSLPRSLTNYIRRQKLIIIVKKETNNLDKLVDFFNDYQDLVDKNILLIDDEADFASVGFRRNNNAQDGISINVLASKLSAIRSGFDNYDFLQVTATPYSLYLQPRGEINLNNEIYKPIRPVFTTLVPTYQGYVGGEEYFEKSKDPNSIFSHLFISVTGQEIDALSRRHLRNLNNILTTPNFSTFRQAIFNYLVAGTIRRLQSKSEGKNYKSSFVIHIATVRDRHNWQQQVTENYLRELSELFKTDDPQLKVYLDHSYNNLKPSIEKNKDKITDKDIIYKELKDAILNDFVGIIIVNSENQILTLLDDNGQLRLDNPFNIFIGGQILDRGLTIENLIGFFYGRNPNTFQQDTVLQHSRMYGNRSLKDIAVTRFYTTNRIYRILQNIHEFDSALREAFEKGIHNNDDGVIFLERTENGVIKPCAPNKILVTNTATIRPFGRYLPVGIQTKARTSIHRIINKIDDILNTVSNNNLDTPFLIDAVDAYKIIDLICETYEYNSHWENEGYEWDSATFKAIIRRLVDNIETVSIRNKIYCLVKTGRNTSRTKNFGTSFSDAPDDGRTDIPQARTLAQETPCLIMLKQEGKSIQGWRDAEFWWPVLITPANTRTAVFATEVLS